jgi:hypothetical protein
MSHPDRTTDRAFSCRRDQPSQRYTSSYSTFHRAREPHDLDSALEIDTSRIPSPTSKNGARPRKAFGQTRTLKGAFEATSRSFTMSDGEGENTPPVPPAGRTPSPRSRRQRNLSLPSPLAEIVSPPPGELEETYRRINDADNLADLVSQDDLEQPQDLSRWRDGAGRRLPPGSVISQVHNEEDNFGPGLSFLDDVTDDSMRRKLANHMRDEERLKRVTSRDSPVFSKAKVGSKALSAENLQRRNREQEEIAEDMEDDLKPSLNVPRSWGSRSRGHREWLNSITRQNGDTPREREPRRSIEREIDADIDFTARSLQISSSPPVRQSLKDAGLSRKIFTTAASPTDNQMKSESEQRRATTEGEAIPNTPIVVYKATPRERSTKRRSDSRELLRKLARTESPSQDSTPEQTKPAEKNVLPDKTPVVIGAWIDTPMTERAAELTEDLSRVIDSPSKPGPDANLTSTSTTTTSTDTKPPEGNNNLTRPLSSEVAAKKQAGTDRQAEPKVKWDVKIKETQQKPKAELLKPRLPKSALETVIEDAKLNGNPLVLGDDTISSLQELLDNDDNKNRPLLKYESDDSTEDVAVGGIDNTSEPGQLQLQTASGKDIQPYDRINSKLQTLIHSIHDARTGLNGLEDHMSPETKQLEGGCCETCGAHSNGKVYVSIPLPRLWRRDPISHRIQPTYLGWTLLVAITWYISESTMCDYYCHPTVAEVCEGYCLRPDAPRFPFTIPTMLWRWSHLSVILSPLLTIFVALVRLLAQLLGLWDGYVDDYLPEAVQAGSSWSEVLGDTPIGGSRNGFYGGPPKVLTTTASSATDAAPSTPPTVLRNMIPSRGGGSGETDRSGEGTIDDDEIL